MAATQPLSDKERFRIFYEECNYWILKFGLKEWLINYEFNDDYTEDWEDGNLAMLCWNPEGGRATIWLNLNWPDHEKYEMQVRRSAFHEIFELFISAMKNYIYKRHFTDSEVDREIHRIVRTMENTWFKEDYEQRGLPQRIQAEHDLEEANPPEGEERRDV